MRACPKSILVGGLIGLSVFKRKIIPFFNEERRTTIKSYVFGDFAKACYLAVILLVLSFGSWYGYTVEKEADHAYVCTEIATKMGPGRDPAAIQVVGACDMRPGPGT